jgi:ribonuclease Z
LQDHSLAYVTDTTAGPEASYGQYLQGVGLLIHECNFNDQQRELAERTGHSTASQVARLAARCRVQRLVLVHLNPTVEDPQPLSLPALTAIFPHVILGRDELEIDW